MIKKNKNRNNKLNKLKHLNNNEKRDWYHFYEIDLMILILRLNEERLNWKILKFEILKKIKFWQFKILIEKRVKKLMNCNF